MAWVKQSFDHDGLEVDLEESMVSMRLHSSPPWFCIPPQTKDQAHAWAMMLRRAARRLEEIGKGLD